jgi:hypothetical protein
MAAFAKSWRSKLACPDGLRAGYHVAQGFSVESSWYALPPNA